VANPWSALSQSGPYVLEQDYRAVEVFNSTAEPKHRLEIETIPEPFLGRLDAPIVVLLLNPGSPEDESYREELLTLFRAPSMMRDHPYIRRRQLWWSKLVKGLRRDGMRDDQISQSILSVEFFPYRSKSFGCAHVRLPSQEFSFHLVRQAMQRKAVIVLARGLKCWLGAVPQLQAHGMIKLGNPRSASLSRSNVGPEAHTRLLAALPDDAACMSA